MGRDVRRKGSIQPLYDNLNAAREARETFYSLKEDPDLIRYPKTRWMFLFVLDYFQVFGFTVS
jgi:hypothetical protein